jgi:hypothetical protein
MLTLHESEDEGTAVLGDIRNLVTSNKALQTRRLEASATMLQECKVSQDKFFCTCKIER